LTSERGKLIAWIFDERCQLMKPVNPDTMNVFPADRDTATVSSCEATNLFVRLLFGDIS
jgi:hypothetical protein